ncbi:gram-negative porin family protein, partial [Yersinia pestis PY-14]
MKNIAM